MKYWQSIAVHDWKERLGRDIFDVLKGAQQVGKALGGCEDIENLRSLSNGRKNGC